MVNILVSNYTNKHLTFHKGEYIGHLEPAVLDSTDQRDIHHAISVTLKKMMSETVTPDTFNPPCHELSAPIQDNLKLLLQEYKSQFDQRQNNNRHYSFDEHDNIYWHCQPSFPKTLSYSYETLSMGER